MRPAPPVDLPLACGRAERAGVLALHGLAWAVAGHWLATQLAPALGAEMVPVIASPLAAHLAASPAVGGLAGGLLGLGMGLRALRRLLPADAPVRLQWTGAAWQLAGQERPIQLDVQIDAGSWLLMRWHCAAASADGAGLTAPAGQRAAPVVPAAKAGWLVARRSVAPQAWHALRVALQAHAGQTAPARAGASMGAP